MDEEDLQDIKDSRKIVDTTDEMDLLSGQAEKQDEGDTECVYIPIVYCPSYSSSCSPLTAALQSAMLPPSKDSVGARILKKMGWRVGQGVGPRITLKQRRMQDLQASTGAGQPMGIVPEDDSEEASKHTYAPRDTPILAVERKDNSHGLGYRPGMSLNENLGVKGGAGASTGPNLSCELPYRHVLF